MGPLISVIIPLYNCERYIEETIQSVLNQTYENIEIIVVDDGSSDNSKEVVKRLQLNDERIKYFYQSNSGVSVARNTGMEKAIGKYIAFLDSDDLWERDKLKLQVKKIEFTNTNACYCGYKRYYESNQFIIENYCQFNEGEIAGDYLKGYEYWAQTSSWLFNKDFIYSNGLKFTPKCNWGEDLEFIFKAISLTRVSCVKEYLMLYRIREESLSQFSISHIKEPYVWINIKNWLQANRNIVVINNIKDAIVRIESYWIPMSIIENYYIALFKMKLNKNYIDYLYTTFFRDYERYLKNFKCFDSYFNFKKFIQLKLIKLRLKYEMHKIRGTI